MIDPGHYQMLALLIFAIGTAGVLLRRDAIVVLMCVELMLGAATLSLVAFSRQHADAEGQLMALFVIAISALQLIVGLALVIAIVRQRGSADLEALDLMRW